MLNKNLLRSTQALLERLSRAIERVVYPTPVDMLNSQLKSAAQKIVKSAAKAGLKPLDKNGEGHLRVIKPEGGKGFEMQIVSVASDATANPEAGVAVHGLRIVFNPAAAVNTANVTIFKYTGTIPLQTDGADIFAGDAAAVFNTSAVAPAEEFNRTAIDKAVIQVQRWIISHKP